MNLLYVLMGAATHRWLRRRYPLWFDAQTILAGIETALDQDGYGE